MAKTLTEVEFGLLQAALGDTVAVHGTCKCEGSEKVVRDFAFEPREGLLVDWEIDAGTREIHSITLQTDRGMSPVCLDIRNSANVWSVEMVVYHKGESIFNVVSAD